MSYAPQGAENHFVRNVPIYENDPRLPPRPSYFTNPVVGNTYDDFRARTSLPQVSYNPALPQNVGVSGINTSVPGLNTGLNTGINTGLSGINTGLNNPIGTGLNQIGNNLNNNLNTGLSGINNLNTGLNALDNVRTGVNNLTNAPGNALNNVTSGPSIISLLESII